MSEKMIAASKLKRRIGCSVTSAAYSGGQARDPEKPPAWRAIRGIPAMRPAWRIIQIGGTGCRRPESTSRKVFDGGGYGSSAGSETGSGRGSRS